MYILSSIVVRYFIPRYLLTSDDPERDIVIGAESLKYAAEALGKISGKVDPEEVLGINIKGACQC